MIFFLDACYMNIPKNLCNDLNRLTTISAISLSVDRLLGVKDVNIPAWKDNLLRDIGILMVYHQALSYIPNTYVGPEDRGMADDFTKTTVLLLTPALMDGEKPNMQTIGMVLAGVMLYHKVVRSPLISFLNEKGIGFNEGIEDMVETLLLLAMSRKQIDPLATASELMSLAIYHAAMKYK